MHSRKLLALLAHPDDETFVCGGTLARYAKEGVEITLVCGTRGEMGRRMGKPPFVNRETMAFLREEELKQACIQLGIHHLKFMGLRDKTVEFENSDALTQHMVQIMKEVQPDVIITFHEEWGGHPDHCAIGHAVKRAYYQVGKEVTALYYLAYGKMTKYPEQLGIDRNDLITIHIKDVRIQKMNAYRAHRSQSEVMTWLWESDSKVIRKFGVKEYFLPENRSRKHKINDLFS